MARSFGEEFRQPIDFFTGKPIPDAPLMGSPQTSRPYNANPGSSGVVRINLESVPDEVRNKSASM